MLSSQTKDQITFSAMNKLKEYGCNSDSLMNASEEKIGQLIYPVGFWKVTHIFIDLCSRFLVLLI